MYVVTLSLIANFGGIVDLLGRGLDIQGLHLFTINFTSTPILN